MLHQESRHQTGKGSGRYRTTKALLKLTPKASDRSVYRRAFDLARREGDTERVAALLWESHEKGDARATYALATWYIHGGLFKIDPRKAFLLLRKSHKAGIPEASFDLGRSYEMGFGTKKDAMKAFECYLDAAMKGDPDAASQVVRCIFWGIGTERNRKLAYFVEDLLSPSEICPQA